MSSATINRFSTISRTGGGNVLTSGMRQEMVSPIIGNGGRVVSDVLDLSQAAQNFLGGAMSGKSRNGLEPQTLSNASASRTMLANAFPPFSTTVNFAARDMSGLNLSGLDMRSADFRFADVSGTNFYGSDLRWANFGNATVGGANFAGADLRGANLGTASGLGINQILFARVDSSTWLPVNLFETAAPEDSSPKLSSTDYTTIYMAEQDYTDESLQYANFSGVTLTGTDFSNGDLTGAVFDNAWVEGVNFTFTNLTNSRFDYAYVTDADFSSTDLTGADLSKAVGLIASQLEYSVYDSTTRLPDNLSYLTVAAAPFSTANRTIAYV